MRYRNRNLVRRKILLEDKQGELKTKLSPMHPKVLLTRQSGLIVAVWLLFLLFMAIYTHGING